jgi:hypothetical protein
MKYLDRLKASNLEKCQPKELQKVQKEPYYSFCSTEGEHIGKTEPVTVRGDAALARLVATVARAYECTDGEIAEAIELALKDYEAARVSFEALAANLGINLNDGRRMCFECAEYRRGACMAAKRGEIKEADRYFEPMKYLPRSCGKFKEGKP